MLRRCPLLGVMVLVPLVLLAGCATPGGSSPSDQQQPAEKTPAVPTQTEPAGEKAQPSQSEAQQPATGREAPSGFSGDSLYRLLSADLAGRQGDLDTALAGYLKAARDTRDPRVAERATHLARYAGRTQAAHQAAQRWVDLAPDDPDAHAVLAQLALADGHPKAAHDHLRRVIALTPKGTGAGIQRVGRLLQKSDHRKVALAVGNALVADYPDNATVRTLLARLAHRAGDEQQALSAANRALEMDPQRVGARVLRARIRVAQGHADAALADLAAATKRQPESSELALGTIRLLIRTDHHEQAVQAMQQAFERFGDEADSVYTLGLLAMQARAFDDAEIYLQRLVAMGARTATAHYYLGRIEQQKGDCRKALRHYIRVSGGGHRLDAELRASVCLAEVGRVNEARLHLKRLAQSVQHGPASVQITLARARVERMAGRPERGLKILGDAVEAQPDQADLRYNRALLAARTDHFELARSDLRRLLKQNPDSGRALNALGYMLADRNLELQQAHQMIKRALAQRPDDAAVLDSMGWVLYRQGQHEKALDYLQRSWQHHQDAEVAAHLGEVLWVTGRRERARAIWRRGHELDPDNAVLQKTRARLAP